MDVASSKAASPQARGRELARLGQQLWQELGSVRLAAAELLSRHPDLASIQAFRYAAGLSQDQAAVRYNQVAGYQTTLGGTTINAWETWARGRATGSPPTLPSLLILAAAYGRGPLGVSNEEISPSDLIAEAYERLAVEDMMALKSLSPSVHTARHPAPAQQRRTAAAGAHANIIGNDFGLTVPTVSNGNPTINVFTLPTPQPGQLLDLTWDTFGFGVERLIRQIKNLGLRLDIDICFGINEAGLVMATFLAAAQFGRCPIGYLKCHKIRDIITLADESFFPDAREAPNILLCDFEVKHADVAGYIAREVRRRYRDAELYFAVFGAMTKGSDLEVASFDDLTGGQIMKAAGFSAVFIAATMSPPGIEPPLELR